MMHQIIRTIFVPFLFSSLFLRSACVTTTNDPDQLTQNMSYYIGLGSNPQAKAQLLKVISAAKTELVGVFNDISDTDVSAALIQKANAGLKVAIGGDQRNQNNAGFAALKALRSSNKFLDYFAATNAAAAEPNQNLKNKILATRLNFNRLKHPTKAKYNAESYDGRVEYNFVVADKYNCWVSTGGANDVTFSNGNSIVFVFQSFDICNDFYNEAQQAAYGGLFGDEGVPSFGKFRNSKTINDPNSRFRLGDLIFNIYFAPQEKPLVPVVTELLRAESSIKFAARAITQDIIVDVNAHGQNRSNILNVMQYKARIPQLYGQAFSLQGILGLEADSFPTSVSRTGPGACAASSANINYNALVSSSCPTINSTTLSLPYIATDTGLNLDCPFLRSGINNLTSIHCDLKTLRDSVNNTGTANILKYPTALPFNVFLTDYGGRKPRLIIMSSDLRKRFYYDDGNIQDAEPLRTQNDFFHITDAFVFVIEPAGSASSSQIFDDFNSMISRLMSSGGSL